MRVILLLLFIPFISNAQWATSSNDIYNSNSGNVGIGVTTPQRLLTLVAPSNTWTFAIQNPSRSNEGFLVGFDNSSHTQVLVTNASNQPKILLNSAGSSYFSDNVGIGTTSPSDKLSIGSLTSTGVSSPDRISLGGTYGTNTSGNSGNLKLKVFDDGANTYGFGISANTFEYQVPVNSVHVWYVNGSEAMRVTSSGTVGIGTTNTQGYKLAVNGDAIFTKVKVKQYGSWPDYVFNSDYKLPTLKEVEEFIKHHKHLPDVPSAKEVQQNGLDVGDNQALLLKKIEELTLYIIEQDKKIADQNKQIQLQQDQLKDLLQLKKDVEMVKTKLRN